MVGLRVFHGHRDFLEDWPVPNMREGMTRYGGSALTFLRGAVRLAGVVLEKSAS